MEWFAMSATYWMDEKLEGVSATTERLFVRLVGYSRNANSEGFLPRKPHVSVGLPSGNRGVMDLVSRGLLTEESDGRYRLVAWKKWNAIGDELEERRESDRERKRRERERKAQMSRDSPGQSRGTRQDKTRQDKEQEIKTCSPASPPSVIESDRFDEFYGIYPRKVGKANAKKAFVKAAKKAGAQTVIDGAHRLAMDPNLPEKDFIPHPATWLNRDGWEDEPHPPRNVQRPQQMTSREQTWLQAELMKDNPDPRAIQLAGGTPQLRMLG